MKKVIFIFFLIATTFQLSKAQENFDTLYFVNGSVEAVKVTGLTEKSVQYVYPGEGIPISTPKNRLEKLITRSGRTIVFENTSKKKTVFTAEDWEKVEITNVEAEVEGLIRIANVSGKAKGATTLSSLDKLQNRAMTKMRMQAAFLGADVIFILNQTNTDARFGSSFSAGQTASSTLSGTAYSVSRVYPNNIADGEYKLSKVYRLLPNEYELKTIPSSRYIGETTITINKNQFFKDEDYFAIRYNIGIPDTNDMMYLIKASDKELVFLVIDRSKQSKIKYYNLFFHRVNKS